MTRLFQMAGTGHTPRLTSHVQEVRGSLGRDAARAEEYEPPSEQMDRDQLPLHSRDPDSVYQAELGRGL